MVEVVVVVEVDGRDSMELGMEDMEGNIKDIVDFPNKDLSNHVSEIGLEVEMAKLSKEGVCPNYFEMDVDNLEIVKWVLASYQVYRDARVSLELHNIASLVISLLHFLLGKIL